MTAEQLLMAGIIGFSLFVLAIIAIMNETR